MPYPYRAIRSKRSCNAALGSTLGLTGGACAKLPDRLSGSTHRFLITALVRTRLFVSLSLLSALLVLASACTDRASKLPQYGAVPAFHMTDSHGMPFDGSRLNGKVWVADFIYSNCPGPCPRMTSQMHRVEQKIHGDNDVRLVSFSVDPARDTPQVLNAFAERFGGPTDQWYFLTGTPDTVHLLAHDVFKVGDIISNMDHSTKFVLVDKHRQLRGYYSTFDADGIPTLLDDLNALRRQRS